MGRVTIYLDAEVEAKMRAAAKSLNTSLSQWIAQAIREKTADVWPESVKDIAGAWSDFPELEELRSGIGEDAPRQTF
jgi:predicted transcriptional regulator